MSPQGTTSGNPELEALRNRKSDEAVVKGIETAGHVGAGAIIAGKAVTTYASGGAAALRCFAGRVIVPLGAAMAGAAIADAVGADEKLLDLLGKPRQASKGGAPAHVGHKIAHNHSFRGMFTGLAAAVLAGALVAGALALTIGTGGLLAPILIGLAAGFAFGTVFGAEKKTADICGEITDGSPNVFFEGEKVARVNDSVKCNRHSDKPVIMEGSKTIFVNGFPLARIGHKITCSAVVQEGCSTILADETSETYGTPDPEYSIGEQLLLSGMELLAARSAVREGGLLSNLLRRLFGEPVDAATGDYASYRTDFEYPGVLPLRLTRTYPGKERVTGLLGSKWICNWSQRLLYDRDAPTVILEDAEGQRLKFNLGNSLEFDALHLKAPYYHLTGTRECARLFDSRTQQILIFTAGENSPDIGTLTAIEDRNENRIDFHYMEGRLCRITHTDGVAFTISTSQNGSIESVTMEGESRELVRYEYDAAGAMTDVYSRFNGEYHYSYTQQGWLCHWHDSGATSADIEYDAEGRVIATRTPGGLYNDRFVYHPEERRTDYIEATGARTTIWFNSDNLPIRERDPLGNVTEHAYDGLERKLFTIDPLGRTTLFEHDLYGILTGETDPAGRKKGYKYDRHGQLTAIQHPDGRKSNFEYDGRGNLVSTIVPDGRAFSYSYDGRGNLLSRTGPDDAPDRWEYTTKGRLSAWIDPLGKRTTFEEDTWRRIRSVTDALGHTTRFCYEACPDNPREDISRIFNPDGGEERFSYDKEGLLSEHTGAEGQVTRYKHGSFDLLRTVIDAKGCITSMEYDGAARLSRITNAAGQKWTYSYDPAGRLAAETDWAGRQTIYTRDAVGRLLTKRLPDGIEQHINWDERDRIVSVASKNMRIAYDYDDWDRLIRATTYGVNSEGPENDHRLVYGEKGRLKQEIQNGVTIDYQYDASGHLTGRKSPSGETSLAYNPLGLLSDYTSNGHGLTFRRNALGLEKERRHNRPDQGLNAFTLTQGYDPCRRLITQTAGRGRTYVNPDRPEIPPMELAGLVSREYKWDKSGRLVGVRDNARGTTSYRYDPRDQLSRVERRTSRAGRPADELYEYDLLMNLAQSYGQSHRYEKDCVTRIGATTYRHDSRGRVIEKKAVKKGFRPKTWRYVWDDFDRLTETYTSDGGHWRYGYDAFGRRIKKECVKAGEFGRRQSVSYLWQGATLAEEWKTYTDKDQLTEVSRWHFEPGTFNPIAKETLQIGVEKAGEPQFYPIVTDHLGTPKEIFDTDGQCLWQAEHTLWGKISVVWHKSQEFNPLPVVDCNLRFQNQWEDEETGLYYNLNRYYDPDSGQYLSQDPVKLHGGLRTHGYVHDPMQWVDPWGLAGCTKLNFDQARSEAFNKAGMTDPSKVKFTKYDPETGTVVEFKGEGGAKVGYDGPHESPGPYHDTQHISWQTAGKRGAGGATRGNIPYEGPQHPSRSNEK